MLIPGKLFRIYWHHIKVHRSTRWRNLRLLRSVGLSDAGHLWNLDFWLKKCITFFLMSIILKNKTIIKGAEETDKVNWKIGERFRQSPELMIKSGPDRFLQIREHVASGKFAYIGVGLLFLI